MLYCIYLLGHLFARECRSYGAQFIFICVYPGFHIGLRPHFTLGYAGVPPLQGYSTMKFYLRVLTEISACTYESVYLVLTSVFACTYESVYLVLTSVFACTYESVYLVLTSVFACTYRNEYVVFILLLLLLMSPFRGGTFPTNAKPQTATIQTKCSL